MIKQLAPKHLLIGMIVPAACFAFLLSTPRHSSSPLTRCASRTKIMASSLSALPNLNNPDGTGASIDDTSEQMKGKHVALYFAAGWCPMCTSFEPSLLKFRDAANSSGSNVQIIYVPSDRKEIDVVKRTSSMNMLSVPIGEEADAMKTRYKIWAGAESLKLGMGRRSGVPALVVLDPKGDEIAFVAAESKGAKALGDWPLDDSGLW